MIHSVWHTITSGMTSWYEAKMFIEHASIVSSDALHVLVGVVVWMLLAILLRRSLASARPLLALLALTLLNEAVDLWIERWPDLAMQYGESAKDVLLTTTLPTCLLLLVRARPGLFDASPRRRGTGGRSRRL